ncbi:hypothetical protein ABHB31_18420, partial [Flavonifractor plautii]
FVQQKSIVNQKERFVLIKIFRLEFFLEPAGVHRFRRVFFAVPTLWELLESILIMSLITGVESWTRQLCLYWRGLVSSKKPCMAGMGRQKLCILWQKNRVTGRNIPLWQRRFGAILITAHIKRG